MHRQKMICSVSKLRELSIKLSKTQFKLNCKLHTCNIFMPLHIESDSCDRSGVGIFCVLLRRMNFTDTFYQPNFSIWRLKKKFSQQLVPPNFGP